MLLYILASDPPPALATWGLIAATFLVLQLFLLVLIGLAVRYTLALTAGWLREKAELVKKIRPVVDSVNTTTEAALKGTPPAELTDNKIIQVVAQVPGQVNSIEEKVEKGSDLVAERVIEFRARTVQAQTMLKAFFLPGLLKRELQAKPPVRELSPGLRKLAEAAAAEVPVEPQDSDAHAQKVGSKRLKDAPVR